MRAAAKLLALSLLISAPAWAVDPPHDFTTLPDDPCASCHIPHESPGGSLTTVTGNANLCISCHNPGGPASALPFDDADQALPAPGLPPATTPSGNSHRWDSGPSGWVEVDAGNTSPGTVTSGGAFTGRFSKTYTLTIVAPGDVGVATFSWVATTPPGGSGGPTLTAAGVALDEGVTVTFTDGASSPAFVAGDQWRLYVRTDLNNPTAPKLQVRLEDGKIMCSTCHNQHSQKEDPFTRHNDSPPPYSGPGDGAGRHFQRVDNDANQMCVDCHSARDVGSSSLGSHPVGPATEGACLTCHGDSFTNFPDQDITPVKTGSGAGMAIVCLSCHAPHDPTGALGLTTDGTLVRQANINTLCTNCHQLADTATPASHLHPVTGVLWPGGQYGSSFPEITDGGKTGFCTNCHQPHGWPESLTSADDYPTLLVETSSELCITCHDGAPASDEMADFSSPLWVTDGAGLLDNTDLNTRHDVLSADQMRSGTDLACTDCHDPHTATPAQKIRPDPDPNDGRVPALQDTWPASPTRSEWCLDCHDGSLPPGVTPPTTALTNVRTTFTDLSNSGDRHGLRTGSASLKPGYGWADDDVVPCTACHMGGPYSTTDPMMEGKGHGNTNLFQLRTTVYSKDGLTPIPTDLAECGGGTVVAVTDNNVQNTAINGWCFCNTCHDDSMGSNRTNCFTSGCHSHGNRM